jgi:hypothetical protein
MKHAELRNEHVWLVVGSLMILATVVLAAALVSSCENSHRNRKPRRKIARPIH